MTRKPSEGEVFCPKPPGFDGLRPTRAQDKARQATEKLARMMGVRLPPIKERSK